jgi:hypothetical protein
MLRQDDPPTEPYRSKYEARRRLLHHHHQQQQQQQQQQPPPLAAARGAFRLGQIAVETEEPHAEAEKPLVEACAVFFPGLHAAVLAAAEGSPPVDDDVVLGEALVEVSERASWVDGWVGGTPRQLLALDNDDDGDL